LGLTLDAIEVMISDIEITGIDPPRPHKLPLKRDKRAA
jgi:hypothetical protein